MSTRQRPAAAAVLLALVLVAGSCGGGGADNGDTTDQVTRTVAVKMVDVGFEPATLHVQQGETVRFTFANDGAVAHDAFVGDTDAQADHEREMRDAAVAGGPAGHGGGDTDAITVEPGDTDELTYTFD